MRYRRHEKGQPLQTFIFRDVLMNISAKLAPLELFSKIENQVLRRHANQCTGECQNPRKLAVFIAVWEVLC